MLERTAFGGSMQKARRAFLAELAPRNVVIAGEGEGRLAQALLARHPDASVTIVDASPMQLERARRRLQRRGHDARCRFVDADLRSFDFGVDRFDLIATPFVLDCFENADLRCLITRLARAATANAEWIHADFVPPERGLRGFRQRAWQRGLYAFFGATAGLETRRLEDPTSMLRCEGFVRVSERRFRLGLLHAQRWVRVASTAETEDLAQNQR